MLLRITNMRGVDLNVFEFDYDLTWAAFFMNGHEKIYGRFGGRDAGSADRYLTLAGLKHALRSALAAHRREPKQSAEKPKPPTRTVEQYPAAASLKAGACIHCHQVYDFRRDSLRKADKWRLDEVWVYPLPENLGMVLDAEQGDRLKSVNPKSPAQRLGMRAGDQLSSVNGQAIATFADVQHALHQAKAKTPIRIAWRHEGKERTADLDPPFDWRKTDISWRASMWGLEPSACVYGQDLKPAEKKALGLPEKGMAFRQGDYVPEPAKHAGIRGGDIIFGIDGKRLEMTMLQFNAYVRLTYKSGDRITFNVLRDGKRLVVPMTLPKGQY